MQQILSLGKEAISVGLGPMSQPFAHRSCDCWLSVTCLGRSEAEVVLITWQCLLDEIFPVQPSGKQTLSLAVNPHLEPSRLLRCRPDTFHSIRPRGLGARLARKSQPQDAATARSGIVSRHTVLRTFHCRLLSSSLAIMSSPPDQAPPVRRRTTNRTTVSDASSNPDSMRRRRTADAGGFEKVDPNAWVMDQCSAYDSLTWEVVKAYLERKWPNAEKPFTCTRCRFRGPVSGENVAGRGCQN